MPCGAGLSGGSLGVTFTNLRVAGVHCMSLADAKLTATSVAVSFRPWSPVIRPSGR
jgi:hypothetical protein